MGVRIEIDPAIFLGAILWKLLDLQSPRITPPPARAIDGSGIEPSNHCSEKPTVLELYACAPPCLFRLKAPLVLKPYGKRTVGVHLRDLSVQWSSLRIEQCHGYTS